MPDEEFGWVGWGPDGTSRNLPPGVRERLEQSIEERRRGRGSQIATIVVDVFENGEAHPYVQFPAGSPLGPEKAEETRHAVELAVDALANWR